jgi:hypothetical protein
MDNIEVTLQKKFAKHFWPDADNVACPSWFSEKAGWVYADAIELLKEQQKTIVTLESIIAEYEKQNGQNQK